MVDGEGVLRLLDNKVMDFSALRKTPCPVEGDLKDHRTDINMLELSTETIIGCALLLSA